MPSLTLEALSGDIHPLLHRVRADSPVAWVPALDAWLVTSRELVIDALRDPDTYTVDDPRFSTAQVVGPSMLSLDGAAHARNRTPFATPFRRRPTIEAYRARTVELAAARVAQLPPGGPADLRAELAGPLAAATITEALGLVGVGTAELLGWYRRIVAGVEAVTAGTPVPATATDAFAELSDAVDRSRATAGTLLSRIDQAGRLESEELHSNTAIMLFGAIETSEGMTTNALYHLLSNPRALDAVASDRSLVPNAVEESLRMEPAATIVDRFTTRETALGGVALPGRAHLSLSLAAANRDPAVYRDPDAFDVRRRDAGTHLSFVVGPHACIGMHLARLETIAAVDAVLDQCSGIGLADPHQAGPGGLVFRKPATLWAQWQS